MSLAYLDNNATTPIAPEVASVMQPFFQDLYGNPSSSHVKGTQLAGVIEEARQQVASFLGAQRSEITFTSGGSESNNHVLKGLFLDRNSFLGGHLVISSFEHPAIQQPAAYLESLGVEVTRIGCDRFGMVDPDAVQNELREDTRLVSIMHANNEIGAIQPIAEISRVCREAGVLCHTDAAQSLGKTQVDVKQLGVDFLTLAGHKLYAPKGVGALYIRDGLKLESLIHGAAHEFGVRAGTENTAYWVGLGEACRLLTAEGIQHYQTLREKRDLLWQRLAASIPEITVNGKFEDVDQDSRNRLPNTLSVNFPRVIGGELLVATPSVCASTGAACHSGETKLSDTLKAIGLPAELARGTVRLSVGRMTTTEEVEQGAAALISSWQSMVARE
ncbi:MAG: cysteine desulfurase NifS [Planctomycetaceae bacterium]|nr:cysteine desulfurase NifS [Planctomycetaceae bacterium]